MVAQSLTFVYKCKHYVSGYNLADGTTRLQGLAVSSISWMSDTLWLRKGNKSRKPT
jgi:hypothetical protein